MIYNEFDELGIDINDCVRVYDKRWVQPRIDGKKRGPYDMTKAPEQTGWKILPYEAGPGTFIKTWPGYDKTFELLSAAQIADEFEGDVRDQFLDDLSKGEKVFRINMRPQWRFSLYSTKYTEAMADEYSTSEVYCRTRNAAAGDVDVVDFDLDVVWNEARDICTLNHNITVNGVNDEDIKTGAWLNIYFYPVEDQSKTDWDFDRDVSMYYKDLDRPFIVSFDPAKRGDHTFPFPADHFKTMKVGMTLSVNRDAHPDLSKEFDII